MVKMERKRKKAWPSRIPGVAWLSDKLLPYFPALRKKLTIAEMDKTAEEFMDWVLLNSFIYTLVFVILFGVLLYIQFIPPYYALVLVPLLLPVFFYYFFHYPDVLMYRKRREIERDLVFAVKHIIIEVSSGVPLFDAIVGVTKGYGKVSEEFERIVERVTLGEPLTHVLRDVSNKTPSPAFQRVLIQIANAAVSGSDVAKSLEVVANQIAKEQLISLKEYGQKLNPLIMFYLILSVIFPSLGISFLIVLLSFVSQVSFPFYYLLLVALLIGLFQFLFLAYVESSRPRYTMLD